MDKNLGLFGGTFDPIHYGHLGIAELFLEKCNLEKCIFIPAKVSPFKIQNKDVLYSSNERFNLIKKAIAYNPKFEISDFEINNENEISYSINTIRYFYSKYSNYKLFFLIGTDQALNFNKWKEYDNILKIVQVVIANRPEEISEAERKIIDDIFENKEIWLNNKIFSVTATEIRKKLKMNGGKFSYTIKD